MEKEAYYFPHFCNARHDRKIRRLRKELGVEGYGIYFMLLETLREQQDLMYPIEDLDLLAEEFGVSEAKVRVAIFNYELFEIDSDQKFFSPKMLVYLEPYFKMKEQRRLAGRKSAEARAINSTSSTAVQQNPTTDEQRKVNESKVNKTKESIITQTLSELARPHFLYQDDEWDKFCSYWEEKDKKGRERWQCEKFFDVGRRAKTWLENANKFKSNGNNQVKSGGTSIDRMEAIRKF